MCVGEGEGEEREGFLRLRGGRVDGGGGRERWSGVVGR